MENKHLIIDPSQLPYYIGEEECKEVYLDCGCHLTQEPANVENTWVRALVILDGIRHLGIAEPANLFLYYDGCILQRGDGVDPSRVRVYLHHVIMFWGDCPDCVLDLINDSGVYEPNT